MTSKNSPTLFLETAHSHFQPDSLNNTIATSEYLTQAKRLLSKIRLMVPMNDREYAHYIQPSLDTLLDYYYHFPASEMHHHAYEGGLILHSLEVGYYTLALAEAHIFADIGSPQERKRLDLKWRIAALLAGLLHDIGRILADFQVESTECQRQWNPYQLSFKAWLNEYNISKYRLNWQAGRFKKHESLGGIGMNLILSPTTIAWLGETDYEVILALTQALNYVDKNALLSKLLIKADQLSVESDLKANSRTILSGNQTPTVTLVKQVMLALFQDGTWRINQKGARLWGYTVDGKLKLFLVWRQAVLEIMQRVSELQFSGFNYDENALFELLLKTEIIGIDTDKNGFYKLAPKCLGDETKPIFLNMVQINDPKWLITETPITETELILFEELNTSPVTAIINTNSNSTNLIESANQESDPLSIHVNLKGDRMLKSPDTINLEKLEISITEANGSLPELPSLEAKPKIKRKNTSEQFKWLLQKLSTQWLSLVKEDNHGIVINLTELRKANHASDLSDSDLINALIDSPLCQFEPDDQLKIAMTLPQLILVDKSH